MLTIRRAEERGHADHGWLNSHHTFSFANYHDPEHMGFRSLRVINDDTVQGGGGFGSHPHRDMEIISYVLDGKLSHKDSMGTGSIIERGDVQRMSAGTGVVHSEFNASAATPVHFLQIWLLPNARVAPSYEQKRFNDEDKRGRLRLVASSDARDGSVLLHTDADVYSTLLGQGERVEHVLAEGRGAWIHVASGSATVNGERLSAGDAASSENGGTIVLEGIDNAEVLLFDLA
jgi:redox-sensitive bicupin YhaK (pirin superfamily)